ncbi:hypothetical protein ACSSS7_006335 [Eimeria intestinalis]
MPLGQGGSHPPCLRPGPPHRARARHAAAGAAVDLSPAYEQVDGGFVPLLPSPNSCLEPEELTQLRQLLYDFRDRFNDGRAPLPATNLLTARVDTGDAASISTRPRRLCPVMRQVVRDAVAPVALRTITTPFQRMVDMLLVGMKWVSAVGYIDDIIPPVPANPSGHQKPKPPGALSASPSVPNPFSPYDRPFYLDCDGLSGGLGAVLLQPYEDGERIIAYASRSLHDHEKKWTAPELEAAVVIWALETFRDTSRCVRSKVMITPFYAIGPVQGLFWKDLDWPVSPCAARAARLPPHGRAAGAARARRAAPPGYGVLCL